MRNYILLLLLSLLLISCGSNPAQTASAQTPAASATAAQAAATVAPSAEPSPTAMPLPFSGPNPRLALLASQAGQTVAHVIELGSEELVASVPAEGSWKLVLSPDGRKLFSYVVDGPSMLYDLESGESRAIDLTSLVKAPETDVLLQAV